MQGLWEWFERQILPLEGTDGDRPLFNFYRDEVSGVDREGGARTRCENLRRYLESFAAAPQTLAVGEAPGWRGCRFTGIPFTSEALIANEGWPFAVERTSLLQLPACEPTATMFWRTAGPWTGRILAWNCIPLHPHLPGQPLTNRSPAPAEIRHYLPQLAALVELLKPRQILAIGLCAQSAMKRAGIPFIPIRHPSHGGARQFSNNLLAAMAAEPA